MVRTRDLVLFVVTVVFLVVAIGGTLWFEIRQTHREQEGSVEFVPGTSKQSGEEVASEEIDRASIVARLRQALVSDTSTIDPVPSVTTEADAAATNTDTATTGTKVRRCATPDDILPRVGMWPLAGTEVEVREGGRVFYTEAPAAHTSSSTAANELVRKEYLALPLMPSVGGSYCVPSEVIGVTPQGVLIFNSDVEDYATANEHLLIGYARDGHPIYGAYQGEVDECGGYQHPAGYRYVIKPGRNHIVSCFVAPPQPFTF